MTFAYMGHVLVLLLSRDCVGVASTLVDLVRFARNVWNVLYSGIFDFNLIVNGLGTDN
jgi:hypothetical protein